MNKLSITIDNRTFEIDFDLSRAMDSSLTVYVDGEPVRVTVPDLKGPLSLHGWLLIEDKPYELNYDPDMHWIESTDGRHTIDIRDTNALAVRPRSGDGRVKAPIPGLITRILVEQDQAVEIGQPLIVLEAMKMENIIRAPNAGVVTAVHVESGQSVTQDTVLIEVS